MLLLERRVAELEKESETSVEQHARLRQENLQLVHRANALEEQLKEQELHADEQLQQETRRQKEALIKLERERGLELENLQGRWAGSKHNYLLYVKCALFWLRTHGIDRILEQNHCLLPWLVINMYLLVCWLHQIYVILKHIFYCHVGVEFDIFFQKVGSILPPSGSSLPQSRNT